MLFYDPILSRDSTMSCASCHKQQYAFSDSPNQLSAGSDGEILARNTMPLYNLAWTNAFFWDGKVSTIEAQVFHPVRAHDEMNLDWKTAAQRLEISKRYKSIFEKVFGKTPIDSNHVALAIAQFERTLISHNSKNDQVLRGEAYFTKDEFDGFELINDQTKGDCLHCHTTDGNALGTTGKFSNNGLDNTIQATDYLDLGKAGNTKDQNDVGQFRIPSLRNVEVTGPYMHDGRFETLEEVINFYSEDEKCKILAFLKTLTDKTFLNNPEFGNPHKN